MTELREALMAVFNGRRDVYAEQLTRTRMGADGNPERGATWRLVEKPLTDQLLDQHLAGKRTVGTYLHQEGSLVGFALWDVDTRDHSPVRLMLQALEEWEIESLLFDSGSKGYHLVAAFSELLPGNIAYAFTRSIWHQAGEPEHVDLFPRQGAITPERPYGNQVKLPLGVHRGTGESSMTTQTELFNSDALRVQPPLASASEALTLGRGVRVVVTRGSWAGVEGVIHDMPAPDVPDRRYGVALDGYGVLAFGAELLERA